MAISSSRILDLLTAAANDERAGMRQNLSHVYNYRRTFFHMSADERLAFDLSC